MGIDDYCKKLDSHLTGIDNPEKRLEAAAGILGQAYKVSADEVAIFVLDDEKDILHFWWPRKLKTIGFLPLSSIDSLAARTVRENKPFVNNRFASVHHASIFERVRLEPTSAEKPLPIQKIVSVPIPGTDRVRGAIQVSRKGANVDDVNDFTPRDMTYLVDIASVMSRHLD
jgi:hypothetical protein